MKYVDQLPNGYVFVEEGEICPAKRLMADANVAHLKWEEYEFDCALFMRYDPARHRVMAHKPEHSKRSEW
jgi:hypothetical protein